MALGHNLDDTAQSILMNLGKGEMERIIRLAPTHRRPWMALHHVSYPSGGFLNVRYTPMQLGRSYPFIMMIVRMHPALFDRSTGHILRRWRAPIPGPCMAWFIRWMPSANCGPLQTTLLNHGNQDKPQNARNAGHLRANPFAKPVYSNHGWLKSVNEHQSKLSTSPSISCGRPQ